MSAVDDIAMSLKGLAKITLVLVGAIIVGGILAGVATAVAPSLLRGTPLGPGSSASPLLWTVIAIGLLWGVQEVRD